MGFLDRLLGRTPAPPPKAAPPRPAPPPPPAPPPAPAPPPPPPPPPAAAPPPLQAAAAPPPARPYGELPSTALNFNAVAPIDATTWRPYHWPAPGLRTVYNRGDWLSRHKVVDGDWTLPDAWVDGCIAQGMRPLALMTDVGPFDEQRTADHAVAVMRRYIGRVHDFEWGNETDTEGSWCFDGNSGGTTTGRMWRVATDAMRSIDPNVRIICGNLQSIWPTGHGWQVLRHALDAYGPWVPEDIALHCYPTSQAEIDMIPRMVERARGVCASHAKGDARFWMSEWSYWPGQFSSWTADQQLAFLVQMLLRFIDAGVYASIHYLFDDPSAFGFRDRAAGIQIWNAAVARVYG